ncbi:MAG TPA: hypothetical protein VHY09_05165, partial [Candidatus Methylacidiphilales bacterium]|nr:hypothetical protein [Candidatus Methylacidiphilales bacterium]
MPTLTRWGLVLALLPLLCPTALRADEPGLAPFPHLTRYLTARDLDARLKEVPIDAHLADTKPNEPQIVRVEPRVTYQEILGFGGAFTDAAGYVLQKMP